MEIPQIPEQSEARRRGIGRRMLEFLRIVDRTQSPASVEQTQPESQLDPEIAKRQDWARVAGAIGANPNRPVRAGEEVPTQMTPQEAWTKMANAMGADPRAPQHGYEPTGHVPATEPVLNINKPYIVGGGDVAAQQPALTGQEYWQSQGYPAAPESTLSGRR